MRLVKDLEKKHDKLSKAVTDFIKSSTDQQKKQNDWVSKELAAVEKRSSDRHATQAGEIATVRTSAEIAVKELPAMERRLLSKIAAQDAQIKSLIDANKKLEERITKEAKRLEDRIDYDRDFVFNILRQRKEELYKQLNSQEKTCLKRFESLR